ncbi:MAG: DNA-binding response OmpR family regulator [Candidatus Latescibacterota bacterium]
MAKILIIDDDEMFRIFLTDLLTSEGYEIFAAKDGNTGVEMFKEVSPDLIVTDILMPEKEGIETIREIRQESSVVKIIALSGGGTHPTGLDYLQMALELGANLSFPKPFKISEFRTAVAKLIST